MERRLLPRYKVDWPVQITGRNKDGVRYFGEGVLEDISARGAYFFTEVSLEAGERLDVSIKLPLSSDKWMIQSGRVIRVVPADRKVGVAIAFDTSKPVFTDM